MEKSVFYAANQHDTRFGEISRLSLHAEMHVLKQYIAQNFKTSSFKTRNKIINKSVIYVVRRLANKENLPENQNCWLGNSKPCIHCQSYLAKYGFKKIKYTDIIDGVNVMCELRLKK